jgi:flagellin
VQDTDYAAATSELSKSQILQQASTAMVAQANTIPQNVLTLLQKLP